MRISDWSSDVCSSDLFLVLRNGLGNGATVVCFCRLNTALPAAPAKLHQTAFRQPAVWNIARQGRLNDGTGAWTQAYIFVQIAQTRQEERRVGKEVVSTCRNRGQPATKKKKKKT